MPRFRLCIVALLLVAAACGDDAESAAPAPAAQPAEAGGAEPWTQIPPDSLYGATAAENVRVTPVVLDVARLPAGWEGMRIAAISDLHLGLWHDNERVAGAAIRRAVAANPDLIVLLGDYVESEADTAALARVLAPLRGRQVLAVLGDRDVRNDTLEAAVTRTLSAAGVRVLSNSAAPVTRGNTTASVAGIDPEMVDDSWGDQEYILATMGGGAQPSLLLTHIPPLAARMPQGRYAAVLAGNTNCGRLPVPGTPRLSWLNTEALPGAVVEGTERLYRIREALMFVTCGVGFSFVPVRLGAPPEVALVTLRGPAAVEPVVAGPDTTSMDTLLQRYQRGDTAARAPTG